MSSVPLSSDETYGSTAEDRSGADATEPTNQAHDQSQSQSQQVDATGEGNVSQESDWVKIRVVRYMDGGEMCYRMKRSAKMGQLMTAYADRHGQELAGLRFLFDGRRIKKDDTPASLDMEADDIVEVASEQTAGGGFNFGY